MCDQFLEVQAISKKVIVPLMSRICFTYNIRFNNTITLAQFKFSIFSLVIVGAIIVVTPKSIFNLVKEQDLLKMTQLAPESKSKSIFNFPRPSLSSLGSNNSYLLPWAPWAPYGSPKLPWTPLGSNSSYLLPKAWLYEIRTNFLNLQAAKTSPSLWLLSTELLYFVPLLMKTVPNTCPDEQNIRFNKSWPVRPGCQRCVSSYWKCRQNNM